MIKNHRRRVAVTLLYFFLTCQQWWLVSRIYGSRQRILSAAYQTAAELGVSDTVAQSVGNDAVQKYMPYPTGLIASSVLVTLVLLVFALVTIHLWPDPDSDT